MPGLNINNLLNLDLPEINVGLGGGDGGVGGGGGGGLALLDVLEILGTPGDVNGGKVGDIFIGGSGADVANLLGVVAGGGGGLTEGGAGFDVLGITDPLLALGGGAGGGLGITAADLGIGASDTLLLDGATANLDTTGYDVTGGTLTIFGGSGAGGGVTVDLAEILGPLDPVLTLLDPVLGILGLDDLLNTLSDGLLAAQDGAGVNVAAITQSAGEVNILGGLGGGGGLATLNMNPNADTSGGSGGGVTVGTAAITGGTFNVYGGAGGGANATLGLGSKGGDGFGGTLNGGTMSELTSTKSVLNIYSGADGADVNSAVLGLLDLDVLDEPALGGEGYGGRVNNFTVNGGRMNIYNGTSEHAPDTYAKYNPSGYANGQFTYDPNDPSLATANNITMTGGEIHLEGGRMIGNYVQTGGTLYLSGGLFNINPAGASNTYAGGAIISEVNKAMNGGRGEVLTGARFIGASGGGNGTVTASASGSYYLTLEKAAIGSATANLILNGGVNLSNSAMSAGGITLTGASSIITGTYTQTGGTLTLKGGNAQDAVDTISGGFIVADGGANMLSETLFTDNGGSTPTDVVTSIANGGTLTLHDSTVNGANVALTVGSGVTLDGGTLTSGRIVMQAGSKLTGVYTQTTGTLDISNTTVAGGAAINIAGGEIHAHDGNATLSIGSTANAIFNITGTVLAKVADQTTTNILTLIGATVTGDLTTSGAVELTDATLNAGGAIHLAENGLLDGDYVQNDGILYLAGGAVKDSTATATFLGGEIHAIDGERTLDHATFKGDVDLVANGSHELILNGSTFETGALVDIDGGVTLRNATNNGGDLTLSAADPANPNNADGLGGTLQGPYTQTAGSLTLNGGTIDRAGGPNGRFDMTISGGAVTANIDTTIDNMKLTGGTVTTNADSTIASLTVDAASSDGSAATLTTKNGGTLEVAATTVSEGKLTVGGNTVLADNTVVSGGTLKLIENAVLDGTYNQTGGTLWMNTATIDGWQIDDGELTAGTLILDFIQAGMLQLTIASSGTYNIQTRNGNTFKLFGDAGGDPQGGDTDITIDDGGEFEGDIHDGGKLTNNGGDADIGVIDGGEYEQNDGTSTIGELTDNGKITQNGGDTTLDLMSGGTYDMNGGTTDIGRITDGKYTQTGGDSTIGGISGGDIAVSGGTSKIGTLTGDGSISLSGDGEIGLDLMSGGTFAMSGGTSDVGNMTNGTYLQTGGDTTLGELGGGTFTISGGTSGVGRMTGGKYIQVAGTTTLGNFDGGSYEMRTGTTAINGYSGGSYLQTGGNLKIGSNIRVADGSTFDVRAGTVTNTSGKDYALEGWTITRWVQGGVAQTVDISGDPDSAVAIDRFNVDGGILRAGNYTTTTDATVSNNGEFILSGNAQLNSITLNTNGRLTYDGSHMLDGKLTMNGGVFNFKSDTRRDTAYLGYIESVTGSGTFAFNNNSIAAGDFLILDKAVGDFIVSVGDISNVDSLDSVIFLANIVGDDKATFTLANDGLIENGATFVRATLKTDKNTVTDVVSGLNSQTPAEPQALLAKAAAPTANAIEVSEGTLDHILTDHGGDMFELYGLNIEGRAFGPGGGGGAVLTETALGIGNAAAIGISQANVAMYELGRHFGALRETKESWRDGGYYMAPRMEIWAGTYTHHTTVETMGKATMRMWGLDIGADRLFNCFADGKLYLGAVAGGQWLSDFDIRQGYGSDGQGEGSAFSLGLYASYMNDNGWFGSLSARHIWSDIDMTSHTLGGSAATYNPTRTMFSVAGEVGKRFDIGETWFVEPSVGLIGTLMGSDSFRTSTGFDVDYDSTTALEGTAAVAFGYKAERFTPFVKMALIHAFGGKTDVRFDTERYTSDSSGTRFRIGLGGTLALTEKLSLFLEAAYEKGSDFRDINGNFGINFSW